MVDTTIRGADLPPLTFHFDAGSASKDPQPDESPLVEIRKVLQSFNFDGAGTGAPQLDAPVSDFIDADEVNLLLIALDAAAGRQRVKTGVQAIKLNDIQKAEIKKKVQDAIDKAIEKAAEAKKAAEDAKIANWLVAAAAVVGAIALIAMSGGAATPLAIGLAVAACTIAVGTAGLSVANAACQEAGEDIDLSMSGMVNAIIDAQLASGQMVETHVKDGVTYDQNNVPITDEYRANHPGATYWTEDELADWRMGWGITAELLVALTALACGMGSVAAGAKAAKAAQGISQASKVGTAAEYWGTRASLTAEATSASATIYGGTKDLEVAEINQDTDRARAQKKLFESMMKALAQELGVQHDSIRAVMTQLQEVFERVSANIAAAANLNVDISLINRRG
jgi:hypothetical protein